MDDQLRQDVEQAVNDGGDIRTKIRDAVEAAAERAKSTSTRLTDLSTQTVETAISAIERAVPEEPESTLHQVIDGLADGLGRTAQATKLALEEAAASGKAYASDDLKSVAADLRSIAGMFVETVEGAVGGAAKHTKTQIGSAKSHAEKTIGAIKPSLESAALAAAQNPVGLVGESASAATKLAREATGSLFGAVGNLLRNTGDKIKPS